MLQERSKKALLFPGLLVFLLMVILASVAQAAGIHYVSPTGSELELWGNCISISSPPCSVQTAFNSADAGDTVHFRGGTYHVPPKDISKGDEYHAYYEPARTGTPGNPITFMAEPGETVLFNGTAGGSGDAPAHPDFATIFGTNNKSYITFDGFSFEASSVYGVRNRDRMARVMIGTSYTNKNGNGHIVFKNCTIDGGTGGSTVRDNRTILSIEGVDDVLVQNNMIAHMRCANSECLISVQNASLIKSYAANRVTIENNEFYDSEVAIYPKSGTDSWIIRNNYLHDNRQDIYINPYVASGGYPCNADNHQIYNNVFSKASPVVAEYAHIHIWTQIENGIYPHADNIQIYNNTFYEPSSTEWGLYLGTNGTNVKFWNNIIQGAQSQQLGFGTGNYYTLAEEDHNCFGGTPFTLTAHYGGYNQYTYTDLSRWKGTTELIGDKNPGEGDKTVPDVLFTGSGNFSSLNDFRLQANSPCKAPAGTNNGDMGANIDLVGRIPAITSIRIAGVSPRYFTTVQAAYDAAASGDTIQVQTVSLMESLNVNRNISVTLDGGYSNDFSAKVDNTTLKGQIQTFAGGGTITVKNFILNP